MGASGRCASQALVLLKRHPGGATAETSNRSCSLLVRTLVDPCGALHSTAYVDHIWAALIGNTPREAKTSPKAKTNKLVPYGGGVHQGPN